MSSDNAAKEHKVCLTWNGRHDIVALTPNMTMHDLRNSAKQFFSIDGNLTLSAGHPPKEIKS
jgi:hypothetical protein